MKFKVYFLNLFQVLLVCASIFFFYYQTEFDNQREDKVFDVQSSSIIEGLQLFRRESFGRNYEFHAVHLQINDMTDYSFDTASGYFLDKDTSSKHESDGVQTTRRPQLKTHFKALKGSFLTSKEHLQLSEGVLWNRESRFKAKKIDFTVNSGEMKAFKDVQVTYHQKELDQNVLVYSEKLKGNLNQKNYHFLKEVSGKVVREKGYEGQLNFESEEMFLDDNSKKVELKGAVKIKRNEYQAEGGKALILLENFNKKLKYYALYDDTIYREFLGDKIVRKAYAQIIEGNIRDELVTLNGSPRVEQDDEIIKGQKIVIKERTKALEVLDSQTRINFDKSE